MNKPLLPMSEAKSWETFSWNPRSPFESVMIQSIINEVKYTEEEVYGSIMSIWQLYDTNSVDYYYVIYIDSDRSLQYMIRRFNLTENSNLQAGTYYKNRFAVSSTVFNTYIKSKTSVSYQPYTIIFQMNL